MNNWTGSGFISRDVDVKEIKTKSGEDMKMARFSVACQRKGKNAGADFISCVAYGKNADVVDKYFGRGKGIEVKGHIQTGSYDGKNGKVYTTEVVVDEVEFPKLRKSDVESVQGDSADFSAQTVNNTSEQEKAENEPPKAPENSFMDIPTEAELGELPFR